MTNRELRSYVLLDVFKDGLALTTPKMLKIVLHPKSLLFFGLATLALYASDPPGFLQVMPWYLAALIWPLAGAIYLSMHCGLQTAILRLSPKGTTSRIYSALLCGIAMLPTVAISETLAVALSGGVYDPNVAARYAFYFVTILVFETIYFRFVVPLIDAAQDEPEALPSHIEDTPPPALLVNGERYELADIRYFTAQQHFVRIVTHDGAVEHRARIGDLLPQTVGFDGIQTHRSWWVSRAGQPMLDDSNARPLLRLSDQTEIPIARARLDEVRLWLARPKA